jgi:hypothetical protein
MAHEVADDEKQMPFPRTMPVMFARESVVCPVVVTATVRVVAAVPLAAVWKT